jgi:hypothetical protein
MPIILAYSMKRKKSKATIKPKGKNSVTEQNSYYTVSKLEKSIKQGIEAELPQT